MTRKICKYENVKESGDVVCLIDQFNNCVGPEKSECFIDQTDTEKLVCGACQTTIKPGTEIMVTMERFSHHERTWPACSEECADILGKSA